MISQLSGLAHRTSLLAAWAGGAMMIFAAFMVTFDVLIRTFFDATLGGADEIAGYLFAIATAWALPYALLHRANVRIDALYILLPPGPRAGLDLFGLILLAIFVGVLTWRAVDLFITSYTSGALSVTPLHVPLGLPQGFWVVGWLIMCLCLMLVLLQVVGALFKGDFRRVHELGGALSLEEELTEEGIDTSTRPRIGDD